MSQRPRTHGYAKALVKTEIMCGSNSLESASHLAVQSSSRPSSVYSKLASLDSVNCSQQSCAERSDAASDGHNKDDLVEIGNQFALLDTVKFMNAGQLDVRGDC